MLVWLFMVTTLKVLNIKSQSLPIHIHIHPLLTVTTLEGASCTSLSLFGLQAQGQFVM